MRGSFHSLLTRTTLWRWFAAALLVGLVANGVLGLRQSRRLRENSLRVDRSHRIIQAVDRLMSDLVDAETGQRGFLLTEDESYLAPYNAALSSIESTRAELGRLTEHDEHRRSVASLDDPIEKKIAELAETIRLQRNGQRGASLALVKQDIGRGFMDEIRAISRGIVGAEQRRLAERSEVRERTYVQNRLSWTLATTALVSLFGGFLWYSRRTGDRLRAARDRADAASRARAEFLANMSHEIRTPMTSIIGNADILEEELRDPDNLQCVQTIKSSGRHLLAIINDILDLSKIDAGKLDIRREDCEIERVVGEVHSMLGPMAAAKDVGLSVGFDSPVPKVIRSDPSRLRQILVNLIGNAIKFTDHGQVEVLTDYDAATGVLTVRVLDDGIGIKPDRVERLFEPFEQGDSTSTRRYGGTGLGLAISRRLARALDGDITARRRETIGSEFVVTLNVGAFDPDQLKVGRLSVAADDTRDLGWPSLDCRVLVVDDRRDIRFLVRRFVEKCGGETIEASDGREARDIILGDDELGRSIDVCVMDMQMPVMDGPEAVKRLRAAGVDLPIIALTANARKEDREHCLKIGFDDFCPKPIDGRLLVQKILLAAGGTTATSNDGKLSVGV